MQTNVKEAQGTAAVTDDAGSFVLKCWITQVQFVLGCPADAVVLEKLLQELLLVKELQTFDPTGNTHEKMQDWNKHRKTH